MSIVENIETKLKKVLDKNDKDNFIYNFLEAYNQPKSTIKRIKEGDYNLSKNLTIQFYYDQVINTPKIATAYPTGNLSTGLRLRFNLAGVQ